jgi:glycosyltransferase involved in cell wall biosynthesis
MKRTGRPCIVVPHGMLEPWIMQRSARTKRWFWKGFTRSLVERAMAVQVLTEAERDSLTALTAKARAVIIPNFVPAREGDAILPAWWDESFEGKRLFLFFGRLHEKKGIVELCAAWRQFNRTHPAKAAACKLVFCGWIDGLPDFEQTVAQLAGEFGNIHFAGPQYGEEKWRSMAAADFMLLPSKSEGLPMSILEGWSLGLPAIMTDGCNLPLGFERGAAMRTGTGAGAIAASLIDAADMDEAARESMGASGRRLIADHYSEPAFRQHMSALIGQARERRG